MSAALYTLITIILSPITVIGYILWVAYALISGRGAGVSGTAQGPLSARYFEHKLGTRQDDPAARLMLALPNTSPFAINLFTFPMLLGHRLTGFVPKAFRYPFEGEIAPQAEAAARMTFFDQTVDRFAPQVAQFVILGAGFDTRAFRLPASLPIRSFEIDMPKTQAVKRDILAKAGIDASHVTFVPADFEKDNWLKLLVDAGFDLQQPALFLWEGVIPYLDQSAVEDTLSKIGSTAPGSMVAFDYMTTEALTSSALYFRFARAATSAAKEPLKFGIDSTPPTREKLAALLQSCGLSLLEQRTLGDEAKGKRAWGGFAIAIVK